MDRALLALGHFLYWAGAAGLIRRARKGPRVLLYHAVESQEGPHLHGLDSNTTPEVFERHLDYLARYHTVVSLEALGNHALPPGAAVITFDDGYRSVVTEALPRLRRRGMPAVLYVVSEAVGNRHPVWVNELAWRLNLSSAARNVAAGRLGAGPDVSVHTLIARAVASWEPIATTELLALVRAASQELDAVAAMREEQWYVDWDEARALTRDGVTIGNHTATHPVLSRLGREGQQLEMAEGRAAVEREVGRCTSVAYPFGLFDSISPGAAADTGHQSAMAVGEWPSGGRLVRGRVPVRAQDDATIFAELEVVAPLKGVLRRVWRVLSASSSAPDARRPADGA